MGQKTFKIVCYEEAAPIIEKILMATGHEFKSIIMREMQQQGKISDPQVSYDETTRTMKISKTATDKGLVFIHDITGLRLIEYKSLSDGQRYAKFDQQRNGFTVYLKQPNGQVDHPQVVVASEDDLAVELAANENTTDKETKLEVVKS